MALADPPQARWDEARGCYTARKYLRVEPVTGRPVCPSCTIRPAPGGGWAASGAREAAATPQAAADAWWAGVVALHEEQRADALACGRSVKVADALERYIGTVLKAEGRAMTTIVTYRGDARRYVTPYIGRMGVGEVDADTALDLYALLCERGGRGGAPLSPNTVARTRAMLQGAWGYFADRGWCSSNPWRGRGPRYKVEEAVAFSADERDVLGSWMSGALSRPPSGPDAVRERLVALAAYVALNTGVRAGEACALWRRDVHLGAECYVAVGHTVSNIDGSRNETKGKRTRTVEINGALSRALSAHLAWQDGLPEAGPRTPLLAGPDGAAMRPKRLSEEFRRVLDDLGLPPETHFHTLRHTYATSMLQAGADIYTVARQLGHPDAGYTLRRYAHVVPGGAARAAARLQDYYEGGGD